MMFSPVSPAPLPEGSRFRDNPAGYVGMGWGDPQVAAAGGPAHLRGRRARRERAARHPDRLRADRRARRRSFERARKHQARAAAALGEFVDGMPKVMPAGSSLHYMGTVRMGPADDGTSVCDPYSRVWGVPGLVLAGNGLIPTANSMQPDADQRRDRGPRRHRAGRRPGAVRPAGRAS